MFARSRTLYIITILVVIYGIYLRCLNITRPFIYDELWSLLHWVKLPVKEILLLFQNPNNHPLNSLLMKLAVNCCPQSIIVMRLHSLIAGIATIGFTAGCAWLFTRRKIIVILTLLLCAMHAGLIYYSQVARGYGIETALIVIFLFQMLYLQLQRPTLTRQILLAAGLLGSFILACFSQATAILFLTPMLVIHVGYILITQWRKEKSFRENSYHIGTQNSLLIITYALITLFAVWLYILHYQQFHAAVPAGQGVVVHSITELFQAVSSIWQKQFSWLVNLGIIGILFNHRYRKIAVMAPVMVLPAVIAGIIIKFGPPRVYLPLVPIFLIVAAVGLYTYGLLLAQWRKNIIKLLPLLVAVVAVFGYQKRYFAWSEISFRSTVEWLSDNFPIGVAYHCYPPHAGMKIRLAFRHEEKNNIQRLCNNMLFIYADAEPPLKAIDIDKHQGRLTRIAAPASGSYTIVNYPVSKNVTNYFYLLKRVTGADNTRGGLLLAELPLQPAPSAYKIGRQLCDKAGNWALINCWFRPDIRDKHGQKLISCQLVTDDCQLSAAKLLDFEASCRGRVLFFRLIPLTQREVEQLIIAGRK